MKIEQLESGALQLYDMELPMVNICLTKQESDQLEEFLSPKWIKCSDRLPEDYDIVIISGGLGYFTGKKWISVIGTEYNEIQWEVTHWMPLPSCPKKAED